MFELSDEDFKITILKSTQANICLMDKEMLALRRNVDILRGWGAK